MKESNAQEPLKAPFALRIVLDPASPETLALAVEPFPLWELEVEGTFSCRVVAVGKPLEDNVRPVRRPPGEMTGYGRVRCVCLK